jgi:hypothetical protein
MESLYRDRKRALHRVTLHHFPLRAWRSVFGPEMLRPDPTAGTERRKEEKGGRRIEGHAGEEEASRGFSKPTSEERIQVSSSTRLLVTPFGRRDLSREERRALIQEAEDARQEEASLTITAALRARRFKKLLHDNTLTGNDPALVVRPPPPS